LYAIKELLNHAEARSSRLDVRSWTEFIHELAGSWQPDDNMACCVVEKDDLDEKPLAITIANKRDYRHQVGRVKELDGARSHQCLDLGEQWCVEYVVRSRLVTSILHTLGI
jgi:hypothetical protein